MERVDREKMLALTYYREQREKVTRIDTVDPVPEEQLVERRHHFRRLSSRRWPVRRTESRAGARPERTGRTRGNAHREWHFRHGAVRVALRTWPVRRG